MKVRRTERHQMAAKIGKAAKKAKARHKPVISASGRGVVEVAAR